MDQSRRRFIKAGCMGSLLFVGGNHAAAADTKQKKLIKRLPPEELKLPKLKLRIGAMDGVLGGGGPKALEMARKVGLEGVEVAAGSPEEKINISKPEVIEQYKKAMNETKVVVSSICMGLLNRCPFISDPRATRWVSDTIDAAAALGAKTILLAFFGRGALKNRTQMEKAAELLKPLAPIAAKKGVTLGIENTLSAEDNLFILDKAGHPDGLKIYYDIGNSTGNGYNVPKEIRLLGDKIAQIHFKDRKTGLLGQGQVDMAVVAQAMVAIRYNGWITLETKKTLGTEITAAINGGYIRGLFEKWT